MCAYNVKEVGRPVSLAIATPSISLADIMDWSFDDGTDLIYKESGNTRYERSYLGKAVKTLTIKSTDLSMLTAGNLKKGACVSGVVFTAEAPCVGDAGGTTNSIGLQSTSSLVISMDYCMVEESPTNVGSNADGSPGEYTLKLKAVRKPDGTAPTVTVVLN